MTWYLTIRALCILSFVIAFGALFGAGVAADEHRSAWPYLMAFLGFSVAGCILVGLGWTPVHP